MEGKTLEQRMERIELIIEAMAKNMGISLPPEFEGLKPVSKDDKEVRQEKKVDLEVLTTEYLHDIGVPPHIRGYHYLRTAVMMCVNDMGYLNYITKSLYPDIAIQYRTTSSRVERAIRHAIEIAWLRVDIETISTEFSFKIDPSKGKPTNSEFIATVADKIRLQMK